jgi:hydroxymethylpyrimidine pyrophosphatase-like HAD family hydrolase
MKERFGIDLDAHKNEYVFVGDSPNDAPMFAYFPHSVGVANINDFIDRIDSVPTYVTSARCGGGFEECVAALLRGKIGYT